MSHWYRDPGAPGGEQRHDAPTGSMRSARERLAEAQRLRAENAQYPERRPPPQPSISPAVEGPTQPSQWPLRDDSGMYERPGDWPQDAYNYDPQPPQRAFQPPEPPTFLDMNDSPRMQQQYINQQQPQVTYENDDFLSPYAYASPNASRLTGSSLASTSSSLGSIPDFPVPTGVPSGVPAGYTTGPQVAIPSSRRSQTLLGPPPSARRGPSSYYSQISFVSPIAEESEARGSLGSFASSHALPGENADFYLEEGEGEMPSDEETPKVETGREFGAGDRHLETGLVRQASIGKRGKPSLTTIRNSDNGASKSPAVPSARSMLPSQTPQAWEKETNRTAINSPLGNGSVLLDPSSSDETLGKEVDGAVRYMPSRESLRQEKLSSPDMMHPKNYVVSPRSYRSPVSHSGSRSPLFVTDGGDRAFKEMDGASIHSAESANDLQRPGSTLGNRVSSRGPSRMNLDASRESEVRSSMTSLPDLIRRATRLAANLDRGRTASRLGFNWALEDGARTPNSEGSGHGRQRKSQASLSGMLDSFPPPAQTPTSPRTEWPSTNQSSFVPPNKRFYPDEKREKRSLRESCINMRRWKFFLILVILLVCIALAVAIPVTLIVVPRMSASTDKSSAASGSALCKAAIVCQNGGSSVLLQSGGCGCLCTNGYTGPRCTNLSDAGCATTSSGSFQNATVGSQIPDLLRQAGPVFGVPLEGDKVLDIFARMNLTCSGENALITLTGSSNEKRVAKDQQVRRLRRTPTQIASTSNGIVIAASTTSAYTATATSTPVSTAAPGTNKTSRTFARIGVLYVLQESLQLEVALKAQEKLSSYMMTATKQGSTVDYARNITLGNGYAIDLWFFSIKTANGTKVGVGALGNGTKPATKGRRGLLF